LLGCHRLSSQITHHHFFELSVFVEHDRRLVLEQIFPISYEFRAVAASQAPRGRRSPAAGVISRSIPIRQNTCFSDLSRTPLEFPIPCLQRPLPSPGPRRTGASSMTQSATVTRILSILMDPPVTIRASARRKRACFFRTKPGAARKIGRKNGGRSRQRPLEFAAARFIQRHLA
jgi:hypothetical protein